MPRTGPSRADQDLISASAEFGVSVTPTQLERWRAASLLPRNVRRGGGRGMGSTSTMHQDAFAVVLVLGRHTRQGRTAHDAVLRWFLAAGLVPAAGPGAPGPVTPEPPPGAVRAAVLWHHDRQNPAAPLPGTRTDTRNDPGRSGTDGSGDSSNRGTDGGDEDTDADALFARLHRTGRDSV